MDCIVLRTQHTLPETNTSPLKNHGLNTTLLSCLGLWPVFGGYMLVSGSVALVYTLDFYGHIKDQLLVCTRKFVKVRISDL